MTLICEPDLDMVKTNRLAEHNGSKVISFNSYRVNTHTQKQTNCITWTAEWSIKINNRPIYQDLNR